MSDQRASGPTDGAVVVEALYTVLVVVVIVALQVGVFTGWPWWLLSVHGALVVTLLVHQWRRWEAWERKYRWPRT
jgi:hypothetical protein